MNDVRLSPADMQPGLAAFGSLRAEDEPWLSACWTRPTEFDLMVNARNALIFGEPGAGLSALRLQLEQVWQGTITAASGWLLTHWQFNALAGDGQTGSVLAATQQRAVFDEVARALLTHLAGQPQIWAQAPDWVRTVSAWFIQTYLAGDLHYHIETLTLETMLSPDSVAVLQQISADLSRPVLARNAPPVNVIKELARAFPQLGIRGVRIVLADLNTWSESYPDETATMLAALLATLPLFENPAFAYSCFLPASLYPPLSRTSAVERRRVQVFHLRYDEDKLTEIVERRVALALQRSRISLADLGPQELLKTWLQRCGDGTPRSWLETIRPLVAILLSDDNFQTLSEEQFFTFLVAHPPDIWINPTAKQVVIGRRQISDLSEGHFAILRHLVEHEGRVCSRKDLYRVYQKAANSGYEEQGRLANSDISGVLDTALWRLRGAIEPFSANPVLLETRRGTGVRLKSFARD